jgi:hypothetical protein
LNVAVNLPLSGNGAQPYRGSIESGYAGIARLFATDPNPWHWNPYLYCGLPQQFVYLPGMPYAVAALSWLKPSLEPLHAYRIVVALAACFAPVALFLFAAIAGGSARWAMLAAIGFTFCSPAYDLFPAIDADRGLLPIPWRLQVMVKYGEGPHNMGLALAPLALLAVWMAAHERKPWQILAAAAALAAVALTHWIAALSVAFACLLFFLAHATSRPVGFRHWPVLAAGLLGYLLAAFWLTPTFVHTVAFNWPQDAFGYKMLGRQRMAMGVIAGLLLFAWWLFRRLPKERYLCWITLCFLLFAAVTDFHYSRGVTPIPEARRYVLELEMFLALAAAAWMRFGWESRNRLNRVLAAAALVLLVWKGAPQASAYVRHGYDNWKLAPKERTVEYRIAEWMNGHRPRGRVYVTGGLRFRLNSWFDMPQALGTFDSGLQNRSPVDMDDVFRKQLYMRPGREGADSVMLLKAFGVEYLVVHGPRSQEYYKDVRNPTRFEGLLERVYAIEDDIVYRVPFRSMAHVMFSDELERNLSAETLERFTARLDDAQRPLLQVEPDGPNRLRIRGGPVAIGQVVSVLTGYAPGWIAMQDGKPVLVDRDPLGFVRIEARPAERLDLLLDFGPTIEQRVFAALSAVTVLAIAGWWIRSRYSMANTRV